MIKIKHVNALLILMLTFAYNISFCFADDSIPNSIKGQQTNLDNNYNELIKEIKTIKKRQSQQTININESLFQINKAINSIKEDNKNINHNMEIFKSRNKVFSQKLSEAKRKTKRLILFLLIVCSIIIILVIYMMSKYRKKYLFSITTVQI